MRGRGKQKFDLCEAYFGLIPVRNESKRTLLATSAFTTVCCILGQNPARCRRWAKVVILYTIVKGLLYRNRRRMPCLYPCSHYASWRLFHCTQSSNLTPAPPKQSRALPMVRSTLPPLSF